nr:heat shock 70 kDa protein 12B-like [Anser cygnoides]
MATLLEPGVRSLRVGANGEQCPTPSPPGSPGMHHDSCSIAPLTPSQSPRSEARSQQSPSFAVVVAIDFGTTSSGYAFSFCSDPEAIHMMRPMVLAAPGLVLCLPWGPGGWERPWPCCTWGWPWVQAGSSLLRAPAPATSQQPASSVRCRCSPGQDLTMKTELEAVNGKKMQALEVFAHALRFFKQHAVQELKDQCPSLPERDAIRWVITVPAIWKQPAKQFMREAAYKAGLVSPETPEQLLIALEPEAASIYCRKLRLHQLIELSCKPQPNGLAPDHAIDSSFRQGERSWGRARGGCCRVGGPRPRGAQGLFPECLPAPLSSRVWGQPCPGPPSFTRAPLLPPRVDVVGESLTGGDTGWHGVARGGTGPAGLSQCPRSSASISFNPWESRGWRQAPSPPQHRPRTPSRAVPWPKALSGGPVSHSHAPCWGGTLRVPCHCRTPPCPRLSPGQGAPLRVPPHPAAPVPWPCGAVGPWSPPDPRPRHPGGPYGAVGVDLAFERLLCHIFGEDFIATFKAKRPAAWVDLTIAFEARKRAAAPSRASPLNISLPFSFIDFYRKHRGQNVETALKKSNVNFVKWSSQGMLRMSPEAMSELFQPTITQIIKHIDALLKKPEVQGIKFLFLVGGFAESAMLQHAVQAAFGPVCRVIIPQDVGLTILKGAVLFGLDPTIVRVRRSPLTYGVGVLNKFVEGKHPREKLLVKEGKNWCTDIFEKFVSVDQSVALGEVVQRSYCPARAGQRKTIINIYCSATDDVVYITDPGVRKCGTISLELPELGDAGSPPRARREIRAAMQFGDTEIKVTAMDIRTAKTVRATIDFLSN